MSDLVYQRIKEKIISNQLKPDEKLDLALLAEEMQTSRAPVSRAVARLQDDGFVVVLPQSGTFVRRLSPRELNIIFRSRASLERVIVETYGNDIREDDLLRAQDTFLRYSRLERCDDGVLREVLQEDMRFHELLVSTCDEIIRREVQNITDLTKRSRLLLFKAAYSEEARLATLKNNTNCHLSIIHALLRHDTAAAGERVYWDVSSTWEQLRGLSDLIG